jgi:hypothetical protein
MIPFGMNEVTDRLHDLVHEARSIVNKSGRGS